MWRLAVPYLAAVALYGFFPGFVLRLLVLIYPAGDPRRRELVAELYAVRRLERPFWVAEQLETVLFEGLPGRVRAHRPAAGIAMMTAGLALLEAAALWSGRPHRHVDSLVLLSIAVSCCLIAAGAVLVAGRNPVRRTGVVSLGAVAVQFGTTLHGTVGTGGLAVVAGVAVVAVLALPVQLALLLKVTRGRG